MRYLLLIALTGCAQIPADPSRMSADQIREWVKDRSAGVQCVIVNSPWGKGVITTVNLDKSVVFDGAVTVTNECVVTITNDSRKVRP